MTWCGGDGAIDATLKEMMKGNDTDPKTVESAKRLLRHFLRHAQSDEDDGWTTESSANMDADPELEDAGFGTWAPDVGNPPPPKIASEEEMLTKMKFGTLEDPDRRKQLARILWENREVTWEVEPGGAVGVEHEIRLKSDIGFESPDYPRPKGDNEFLREECQKMFASFLESSTSNFVARATVAPKKTIRVNQWARGFASTI